MPFHFDLSQSVVDLFLDAHTAIYDVDLDEDAVNVTTTTSHIAIRQGDFIHYVIFTWHCKGDPSSYITAIGPTPDSACHKLAREMMECLNANNPQEKELLRRFTQFFPSLAQVA